MLAGAKLPIQSVFIEPAMVAFSIGNTTPKVWDSENEETFFLEKTGTFLNCLAFSFKTLQHAYVRNV